MRSFLDWLRWAFGEPYSGLAVALCPWFAAAGILSRTDRMESCTLLSLALATAVWATYKQTTCKSRPPFLSVARVLLPIPVPSGRVVRATVELRGSAAGLLFDAEIHSGRPPAGPEEIAAVIASIRLDKTLGGNFQESWDEYAVPRRSRTPHGLVILRECAAASLGEPV